MLFIILPEEIQKLEGKRIRTTVPNLGSIKATVGKYNVTTNRVDLHNIISEMDGINHGTLSYLPTELGGLQVLDGIGGVPPSETPSEDCTVTGGKGKKIDSGKKSLLETVSVSYEIHECQIEVTPKVLGIAVTKYVLNRSSNRIDVTWPESFTTRYKTSIWVINKQLWIEIEYQGKDLLGRWHKMGGAKTKIGSWASLKF
ncbi:hypothetical protein [Bacillus toyonensis]|nr:hypothetical protein [Bacillus toyonensis]